MFLTATGLKDSEEYFQYFVLQTTKHIHNYQRIHVDTVTFKQNHRKAMDMKKVLIQKNTKDSMNTEN